MTFVPDPTAYAAFRDDMAELLAKHSDLVVPKVCTVHGRNLDECSDDCRDIPDPDGSWFPRDWAIVVGVDQLDPDANLESIRLYTSRTTTWAIAGLLRFAVGIQES